MLSEVGGREVDRALGFKAPQLPCGVLNGKSRNFSKGARVDLSDYATYRLHAIAAGGQQEDKGGKAARYYG